MKTILLTAVILSLLLPGLTGIAASPANASEINFGALDEAIETQMSKHGLPGAALAVIQGDEIVYLKGYGTAGGQEMTAQTQMFIGSQSKSFTALLVAQLAEQGKIELNAPVQTYIPWFTIADEEAAAQITVNHLLHHTSGLSESGFSVVLRSEATPEEAVRALASARLTAPIGKKFQYFNLGYDVLSYVVETVTGQRYADYLDAQVLEPLGMTSTTAKPETAANLSWGYTRLFGFAAPMPQPVRTYEIGAGYIVSTAEDMARYTIAMMNTGAGLVSPATARQMFTPGLGDYGMGWHITRDGTKIYHGGANETFRTDVNIYPKRERAFVLLVNQGHLVDHFVSSPQLTNTVEAVVLGNAPLPVEQGWSVRWMGWGLGVIFLALIVLHTRNFINLFSRWSVRARSMAPVKLAIDVAINFIVPGVILMILFSQMQAFFGYRFNLLTNFVQFPTIMPDVFLLVLVGTLPDYIQGVIKAAWILQGRTKGAKS